MITLFKKNVIDKIIDKIYDNKILNIKLMNDNFTSVFNDIKDSKFNEINEFEIITFTIKGDKKTKKILNIKSYFKIIQNNMDPDYLEKIKNIEIELKTEIQSLKEKNEELKKTNDKEINSLHQKIGSLNEKNKELKKAYDKEINSLHQKINKLEIDHDNLKGRFIFKAFADYVLLLFGIDINLKFDVKKSLLKEETKKNGIVFRDVFFIVHKMRDLYNNETNISHKEFSLDEIKTTILNQFYECDYDFMTKFFDQLNPERDIQSIIKKNNELTKIMVSNNEEKTDEEEKDSKKLGIISEINNILSNEKKNLLIIFKKILKEYYD